MKDDLAEKALGDNAIKGGTSVFVSGDFGSGKSSLLQMWAIRAFNHGHLVILRSKDVDTWQDIASKYPVHVYTPDIFHFDFDDPDQNKNIKYTMIRRPDDMVKSLKRDEINVISVLGSQFGMSFFWAWFSNSLILNKPQKLWTTFIFDEIRDVIDPNPHGKGYWTTYSFLSAFTSFRKKRIHFRASAHKYSNVFWDLMQKFEYKAYLKGAELPPSRKTALKSTMPIIEGVDTTHYILDTNSKFTRTKHPELLGFLGTGNTITIDGNNFDPSNYPIEQLFMGLSPKITCPECGRVFHIDSSVETCPFCRQEIIAADKIAPGTPSIDYDGTATYPPPPLSIEETSEKPAPLSRPTSDHRKTQKSTKHKKSGQKTKREIEKDIER